MDSDEDNDYVEEEDLEGNIIYDLDEKEDILHEKDGG